MTERLKAVLDTDPWLNLVFLLLAILSIAVSIALYVVGKREMKPVYNLKSFTLIKDSISRLDALGVTFHGHKISNLTTSLIAVWNKGEKVINDYDIAPTDPLRIEARKGNEILHAEITHTSDAPNNFSIILLDERTVNIQFDYFGKNEGMIARVYHTGTSNEDITICGTVKNVGQPKYGIVSSDQFTDMIISFLERILPENKILRFPLDVLFTFALMPTLIILAPISEFYKYINKAPKDFSLDNVQS